MHSLLTLASMASLAMGTRALSLPFGFPWCPSTTTVTLGGDYTVTSTTTVTSHNLYHRDKPVVSIKTVLTTSYTPYSVHCLISATTVSPYTLSTLAKRQDTATITLPSVTCPPAPTITIVPPTVTGALCTVYTGDYSLVTDTQTVTTGTVATSTVTPTIVGTLTETLILPTPSVYRGLNYYQYINDYHYPDGAAGCATCGYGGGGYETSDWNGNKSYYSSGTTQQINFQSENYPSYSTILCQLPGQASATDCSQWTVVFQGYLFAPQTGNYTISHGQLVDNAVFWWSGIKAHSSYANNNTDAGISYTQPSGLPLSSTYSLVAGEYLPLTFIYVNGAGPGKNNVTITGPNGLEYPNDLNLFVPPCPNSPFVP